MKDSEAFRIAIIAVQGQTSDRASTCDAVTILQLKLNAALIAEARATQPYMCRLSGRRFGSPYEKRFKCVREAIGAAYWAIERNQFLPITITDMDGKILLDDSQLIAARSAFGARHLCEPNDKFLPDEAMAPWRETDRP